MFHGISAIISGFWGLGIRLTTDHLESTGNFHSQTATADIIDVSMKWFVKAKKLQTWINMVHWTTLTFCYDSLLNDRFLYHLQTFLQNKLANPCIVRDTDSSNDSNTLDSWDILRPCVWKETQNIWPFRVKGKMMTLQILDTLQKKNLCWLVDITIDTKRLKD